MQGQGSVLYFQPSTLTQSALKADAARLDRKRRFEDAARKAVSALRPSTPESDPAQGPPATIAQPETPEQWAERQKERFKEPWFAIVGEISERSQQRVNVLKIQAATANYYGVTRADILSHRRTNDVVKPRQIAMYLCKILTMKTLPEIGRMFGDRDHTTILHAVRKIEDLRVHREDYAVEIASIISSIYPDKSSED